MTDEEDHENLTNRPGVRRTNNLDILQTEAELWNEDGVTLDNPAIPSETVIKGHVEWLDKRDWEPPWTEIERSDSPPGSVKDST